MYDTGSSIQCSVIARGGWGERLGGGERWRGALKREGTQVYLWLIRVDVWQKPSQYCGVIILQLKNNKT